MLIDELKQDIENLRSYRYNWDGYNSLKPKERSINKTLKIIDKVIEQLSQTVFKDSHTYVGADSCGNVIVQWYLNNYDFLMCVEPKETIFLYDYENEIENIVDETIRTDDYSDLTKWINEQVKKSKR